MIDKIPKMASIHHFSVVNSSSCSDKTVPNDMCAFFFNEKDCGGQSYLVPIRHNIRLSDYRFDHLGTKEIIAESLLVRPGCMFIGKDEYLTRDHVQMKSKKFQDFCPPGPPLAWIWKWFTG